MNNLIGVLLKNPVSFLDCTNDKNSVAVCSRIRLARNFAHYAFPTAADSRSFQEVKEQALDAIRDTRTAGAKPLEFSMDELSELEQKILFERRLISRNLLKNPAHRALSVSANEKLAIMINEEDHLRIQSFAPGFNLEECWKKANLADTRLNRKIEFAFDSKIGYLTSCPTNVGTGMRASVMLHLPGLTLTGELESAIRALNKLNFAVRGIFGEGSENTGALFQISNQITLGDSEEEIINKISVTIKQIIVYEQNARESMFKKKQFQVLDYIGRSYGLLKHAYILNEKDALNAISGIKLGVDMEVFSNVSNKIVNEIFLGSGSAHLQYSTQTDFADAEEENVCRAAFAREKIRNNGN